MGLLGKVAGHFAVDAIVKTASKANKKSFNNFFTKKPGTGVLVFVKRKYMWKDRTDVYGENKEIKYTVKSELVSMKHRLYIYDAYDRKIGVVKEKRISLRSFDFIIEMNDNVIGSVKSIWSFGKKKYKVDFNSWHIKGDVFGWNYKIFNRRKEIAHISQKLLYFDDIGGMNQSTYVVSFPAPQNEILILMLVVALAAGNDPK